MTWKKVIVSGSVADFSAVNIDGAVVAATLTGSANFDTLANKPSLHSGSSQVSISDTTGFTAFSESIATSISSISTDWPDITNKPVGLVSSSAQIVEYVIDNTLDLGTGAISASYFVGDGSKLTNIDVSQAATIASTFTNQVTVAVTHNFDSKNVNVVVYDDNDTQILPASVTLTSNNVVTVTFDSSTSGRVVVAKGGHIVSGSIDFNSIANKPTLVSGSGQIVLSQTDGYSTYSSSVDARFTALEQFSSSLDGDFATDAELSNVSASLAASIAGISTDFYDITNKPTLISSSVAGDAQGQIKVNGETVDIPTLQSNSSPTFNTLTLTGDLFVQGTTTSIETANLLVQDKFILLNSGSTNPDLGGIIIDEGSGAGHAFLYNNTSGRFGFTGSLSHDATTATPDAFAAAVIDIAAGHTDKAEYAKNGNIKIDSGIVYIYA